MKTLCMDSAHKHLIIVLLEDGEIKAERVLSCWKRQSETLFPQLIACMEEVGWDSDDLDEVMISDGPGSYTGVRIAMSVAKVLCTRKKLQLYCVSTLQLYAGIQKDAFVMLDARSNRAYIANVQDGNIIGTEAIWNLNDCKAYISQHQHHLYGDVDLIQMESEPVDFAQNFKDLRPLARRIENIHMLTPRYLKEQDSYKVKA